MEWHHRGCGRQKKVLLPPDSAGTSVREVLQAPESAGTSVSEVLQAPGWPRTGITRLLLDCKTRSVHCLPPTWKLHQQKSIMYVNLKPDSSEWHKESDDFLLCSSCTVSQPCQDHSAPSYCCTAGHDTGMQLPNVQEASSTFYTQHKK